LASSNGGGHLQNAITPARESDKLINQNNRVAAIKVSLNKQSAVFSPSSRITLRLFSE